MIFSKMDDIYLFNFKIYLAEIIVTCENRVLLTFIYSVKIMQIRHNTARNLTCNTGDSTKDLLFCNADIRNEPRNEKSALCHSANKQKPKVILVECLLSNPHFVLSEISAVKSGNCCLQVKKSAE